jgi:hypothetical protein
MDQLDAYRERLKMRVMGRANDAINRLGQLRFRPVGQNQGGSIIPASTPEEIALQHVQHQAEAQVLQEVMQMCDEEFRAVMGQPKEPQAPGAAEARAAVEKKILKEGVY